MNAIAQTIKAAQDTEAAKKAAAEAAKAMQEAIYEDARARVDRLIRDFNKTPMELKSVNGIYPLRRQNNCGDEYRLLGKGMRFFLLWAKDGKTLCLALNAECRYAGELAALLPEHSREVLRAYEQSTSFMTLEVAQRAILARSYIQNDYDYPVKGHITADGRFATGKAPYNGTERPDAVCATAVEWMTKIVGGPDVAPYVVLGAKKGKK